MNIGGYQPVSLCDFEGHVAAVVFTQGCDFRCPFCHNAALLPTKVDSSRLIGEEEVLDRLRRRRGKLDAVVVSGGEPTLQPGLPGFLREVRGMGFAAKLDTNGNRPEFLGELMAAGLVDFVAMDVKAPRSKYGLLAGIPVTADRIVESIRIIAGSGVPHEFRTTVAPQFLSPEDLIEIRSMIPPSSRHKLQVFRPARTTQKTGLSRRLAANSAKALQTCRGLNASPSGAGSQPEKQGVPVNRQGEQP